MANTLMQVVNSTAMIFFVSVRTFRCKKNCPLPYVVRALACRMYVTLHPAVCSTGFSLPYVRPPAP